MPVPDTTTAAVVFIDNAPDWSKKIQTVAKHKTTIATATNGAEQRARWRNRPRYSINYTISGLSSAEFSLRRSQYIQELQSPIVVPIWTDSYAIAVTMTDANVVDLGIDLDNKKFKAGSYIYFEPVAPFFRKIVSVNGTQLTLAAGSTLPGNTSPLSLSGVLVYPCILGMHKQTDGGFDMKRANQTDEIFFIEEL